MAKQSKRATVKLNVVEDVVDFRDKLYTPTLIEVPEEVNLTYFQKRIGKNFPVLDQGLEGSCTGFALATVSHYLLRTRKYYSDKIPVSPHMIYALAKKYDDWQGEDYDGSTARAAMKAWHKHGICSLALWKKPEKKNVLDLERACNALLRPLGAYFRVNPKDIVAMHAAITEVGILYATCETHNGWDIIGRDGYIQYDINNQPGGGHAVAIVGYDRDGFWFQNSWGKGWGKGGYGHISYDDWLTNGWDIWVARLGAPVRLAQSQQFATGYSVAKASQNSMSYQTLRPHIVCIGNNGRLRVKGTFGNDEDDIDVIFQQYFPTITKKWKKKRILLYAHGGLVQEEAAIQRLADYHRTLIDNEIYPVFFIWHCGFWETIKDVITGALKKRKAEGYLGEAYNFLIDRTDSLIETASRAEGKKVWRELKENALAATREQRGGARLVAHHLQQLMNNGEDIELHVVGHSAGSIFHAPFLQYLVSEGKIKGGILAGESGLGLKVRTVTQWAPAITTSLFKETYLTLINNGGIESYYQFILDNKTELDDHCADVYGKSLLYLVSHAFEEKRKVPSDSLSGEPLVGMEKWITSDPVLKKFFKRDINLFLSPDSRPEPFCTVKEHGAFDDDDATVKKTLCLMLGIADVKDLHYAAEFNRSSSSLSDRRKSIQERTQPLLIHSL